MMKPWPFVDTRLARQVAAPAAMLLALGGCSSPPADRVILLPGADAIVMQEAVVADGAQSLILRQVANGVAVRMAVLEALLA